MDVLLSEVTVGKRFRKEIGDLADLKASLSERGQLQDIVLDSERRLVAGYRRLKAAKELGWTKIRAHVAKNLPDALARMLAERDENVCRKDFTPSEAVAVGEALEGLERSAAKERQREHGGTAPGKGKDTSGNFPEVKGETRDRVASSLGMSGKTYEAAKKVVASGNETAIKRMDSTGNVNRAFKLVKAEERAERDQQAAKEAAKELAGTKNDRHVIQGPFTEVAKRLPNDSVALIFTDPPYDESSRICKSLPVCWTQTGQNHCRRVPRSWMAVGMCRIPQNVRSDPPGTRNSLPLFKDLADVAARVGIKNKWKTILWFTKGTNRRDPETWCDDFVVSKKEKDHHAWQQSEIEAGYYIEQLTAAGEMVFDPFCGGGTTAAVAKKLGRLWLTCDVDPTAVATSRKRLA